MEINSENLISHASRIKESGKKREKIDSAKESPVTSKIAGKKDSIQEGNSNPNTANQLQDQLHNHVRTLDVSLKKLQNQLTQNQQFTHALNEFASDPNNHSGREILSKIGDKDQNLFSYLAGQKKDALIEKADSSEAKNIMLELSRDIERSDETIILEIKEKINRSEVELENISASGMLNSSDGDKVSQMINNYRSNISLVIQNINPANVDNLVS